MTMVTFTTTDGKKIEFESYEAYFKWDKEMAKKEREEKERREREEAEERARKLANLTEEQKEEIDRLEEKIFLIQMADFLSREDWNNIREYRKQIKEIRGF